MIPFELPAICSVRMEQAHQVVKTGKLKLLRDEWSVPMG